MKINWSKFLSRKFLALIAALITIINAPGPLDIQKLALAIIAVATYIVIEGFVDAKNKSNESPGLKIEGNIIERDKIKKFIDNTIKPNIGSGDS